MEVREEGGEEKKSRGRKTRGERERERERERAREGEQGENNEVKQMKGKDEKEATTTTTRATKSLKKQHWHAQNEDTHVRASQVATCHPKTLHINTSEPKTYIPDDNNNCLNELFVILLYPSRAMVSKISTYTTT